MLQIFSERMALNIMVAIFSVTILFHLLVLTGLIPYDMVWGGRLKDQAQMIQFEIISLLINSLMLLLVLLKTCTIKNNVPQWIFWVGFWAMAVLFLMNTLGNILSNNAMEKAIFTPVTIVLFLCSLRLALGNKKKDIPAPKPNVQM